MIPLSLTISGFLSYRDPAELDFTGFDLCWIEWCRKIVSA
jgi:hypothetical protein